MPARDTSFRFLPSALAESVHHLGIRVRRPVHGRGEGLHRSPDYGASVEFAEYREYTPGDAPNRIDWAVYARSDRYVVRQFHEETSLRATILLDTSESLAFRDEGPMTKLEYGCYLTAGLMYALVRQGDAAGLYTFTERIDTMQPAAGTLSGLRPLLLSLERLKPAGRSDIEAALHETSERIHARSLVVIISDCLQEPERLARGLRHLHHDGHNVILLHVLDPAERRLSFGGVAELRELESGRRLVVDADEIRESYRQAVQQHIDTLYRVCAECLADYHLIDTREPVEGVLHRLQGGKA